MANKKSKGISAAMPQTKRYNRGKDGTNPLDKSYQSRPEGVVEELGGDEIQSLRIVWGGESSLFYEGDFWKDLDEILFNCDEVMLQHGWDRKAGNGRNFPGDRTAEPFSQLWYAGKIGFECWNLLNWHRKNGPNEIALAQSLYLGRLLTEAEWRAAFKPSIVTGASQRRHLRELRDAKNRNAKAGVAKRRNAIAGMIDETRLTGGALDKWLRKQLLERHGLAVSERTIRTDRKALFG